MWQECSWPEQSGGGVPGSGRKAEWTVATLSDGSKEHYSTGEEDEEGEEEAEAENAGEEEGVHEEGEEGEGEEGEGEEGEGEEGEGEEGEGEESEGEESEGGESEAGSIDWEGESLKKEQMLRSLLEFQGHVGPNGMRNFSSPNFPNLGAKIAKS